MKKIIFTLIFCIVFASIVKAELTKWIGFASYYTVKSSGEWTANGERYNENALTCAIWNIPFNTILKVTNIENHKFVLVRVNDRGPAKRLHRIIDLTPRSFLLIGNLKQGLIRVKIEIVKKK